MFKFFQNKPKVHDIHDSLQSYVTLLQTDMRKYHVRDHIRNFNVANCGDH